MATEDEHQSGGRTTSSRRRLLSRGAGALAAVLGAAAIARPAPAAADNGGPVLLGQANTETIGTYIYNNSTTGNDVVLDCTAGGTNAGIQVSAVNGPALEATSTTNIAVHGNCSGSFPAIRADAATGNGVEAEAGGAGDGVLGSNTIGTGNGVHGQAGSSAASGVFGENSGGGNGVYGFSDAGTGVAGVSSSANGVEGESAGSAASGVFGQNGSTGYGVAGQADSGTGVWGDSASSTGVLASSANGTALQVSGKAAFSRSGRLTIAAGKTSAIVTGVALSSASLVLATLQQHVAGVYVVAAVPNVAGSSFTVYLSKAPTASAQVAWFVVN